MWNMFIYVRMHLQSPFSKIVKGLMMQINYVNLKKNKENKTNI